MGLFEVNGKRCIRALLVSVAIAEGVGLLSAFLTMGAMEGYGSLNQPSFAPPGWIFGPVWTLLYFLMGWAAYRIWMLDPKNPEVKRALTFYGIQLFLNFLWSILFFRFELRGVAFFELLLLLIMVIWTTVKFYSLDKLAGYLMIPYVLWTSFALLLNYSVWMLNR